MLFVFPSCDGFKNPFSPDNEYVEPAYIKVVFDYERDLNKTGCLQTRFDAAVLLNGINRGPHPPEFEKIGDNKYYLELDHVKVNYPVDTYGGVEYYLIITDNAFLPVTGHNFDCLKRAHDVWVSGIKVPADKVRTERGGSGEYFILRIDEQGNPYFF